MAKWIFPNKVPTVCEIVTTVLRNHPSDRVFTASALETITARTPDNLSEYELIDYLVFAIQEQEIYCPHEGIDRRELTEAIDAFNNTPSKDIALQCRKMADKYFDNNMITWQEHVAIIQKTNKPAGFTGG